MNQSSTRVRDPLAKTVLSFLQSERPSMIECLRIFAEIETPSSDPDSQRPLQDALRERLEAQEFRVRRLSGTETGGQLLAIPDERSRGQPSQLLLGHTDTVWPRGTLDENPVEVSENRIKGPGVFDMKSGLVQILFALEALRHAGETPPLTPVVFLNSDEEIGSSESARHIRRLARVVDRAFVMEPATGADGSLKVARKGVGRFTVSVKGRASHAGLSPEKGANAIVELSQLVTKLNELNDRERGITVNVGRIDGGLRANVVAPTSRAEVDVRVPDHESARDIEQNIRSLKPSSDRFTLNVEGGFGRPPMEHTEGNRALFERAKMLGSKLGMELSSTHSGGGSDGNITSQHAPTLDGLGAVGGGAHEEFEYVEIEGWIRRTALLALLIMSDPIQP